MSRSLRYVSLGLLIPALLLVLPLAAQKGAKQGQWLILFRGEWKHRLFRRRSHQPR